MIPTDSDTLRPMATGGWATWAECLRDRRIHIDRRYRNRALFFRENGIKPTDSLARIAEAMERAERGNYDGDTIRAVEDLYQFTRGSCAEVLRGGKPTPLEAARPSVNYEPPSPDTAEDLRRQIRVLLPRVPLDQLREIRDSIVRTVPGEDD